MTNALRKASFEDGKQLIGVLFTDALFYQIFTQPAGFMSFVQSVFGVSQDPWEKSLSTLMKDAKAQTRSTG